MSSALVLAAGCSDVVFEGNIEGRDVGLRHSRYIVDKYIMDVDGRFDEAGGRRCRLEIRDWGANGSADELEASCSGGPALYGFDRQEIYDSYMDVINFLLHPDM